MHPVDRAFYEITVRQRNDAWRDLAECAKLAGGFPISFAAVEAVRRLRQFHEELIDVVLRLCDAIEPEHAATSEEVREMSRRLREEVGL